MKSLIIPIISLLCCVSCALAEEPFRGNLLEAALLLRTKFNTSISVDPELLTSKNLTRTVQVDATSAETALRSLESALAANGISVTRIGTEYWVGSSEMEADRGKDIDLLLNATNYTTLVAQLQRELKPSPQTTELLQMARLLSGNESRYFATQRQIAMDYAPKLKNLNFKIRNAASGSSLSAPNPSAAQALAMERDEVVTEIVQRASDAAAQFISALNDPPSEIAALANTVPDVVFEKISADNLMILLRTYELYTNAAGSLGISVSSDEQQSTKTAIERIRKIQQVNSAKVGEYRGLIVKAGLQSGVVGSATMSALDASLKLFDDHNDRRQAVRRAIGAKIMTQLAAVVVEIRSKAVSAKIPMPDTLFMFDANEGRQLKELAKSGSPVTAQPNSYALGNYGRVGASSILAVVAQGKRGEVGSISIELEPKASRSTDPPVSLENIFGSASKQVSIHTSDSEAHLDSYFMASVKDAFDLIQKNYDPKLFDSSISVAFDDTVGIAVGGDSAGVAIGLATLSRTKNIPLDRRIVMTGSIRRYGDVRPVGGVYQKGTAALDDGCVALMLPSQNMENLFYLPVVKVLATHVFTINDFREATGVVQLGAEKDNLAAARSIKLYNYALLAALNGLYGEALAFSQAASEASKTHFSSKVMSMLLRAAEVKPVNSPMVSQIVMEAAILPPSSSGVEQGAVNSAAPQTTQQSGSAPSSSPLATLIPEFAASGITGANALNKLVEEARKVTGMPINIVMQDLDQTKLGSTQINLYFKEVTFMEILEQICAIGKAKFEEKNGLITITPAS